MTPGDVLRRSPLIATWFSLHGNAKMCMATEPMWGIPNQMIAPFVSVYMACLGLSDLNIGTLGTITLVGQVLASLLSGVITDKLGRRRTTFIFDVLSWTVATVIWCFAQNYWWFVAGAVFISINMISGNSWNCLLVEDTPRDKLVHVYAIITIMTNLAVFSLPLASLLVARTSVVFAMRWFYGFAAVCMTAKFVLLWFRSTETRQGAVRMAEMKGASIFRHTFQLKDILAAMLRDGVMRRILALNMLAIIIQQVTTSFFGLYVTKNLMLPERILGYFPVVTSVITLAFLFSLQHVLDRFAVKRVMLAGLALYAASFLVLLTARARGLGTVLVYVVLSALAVVFFQPRKDSFVAVSIDPVERPRITGMISVVTMLIASPFGAIIGYLSELNRRYPFWLCLGVFALMAALVYSFSMESLGKREAGQETGKEIS